MSACIGPELGFANSRRHAAQTGNSKQQTGNSKQETRACPPATQKHRALALALFTIHPSIPPSLPWPALLVPISIPLHGKPRLVARLGNGICPQLARPGSHRWVHGSIKLVEVELAHQPSRLSVRAHGRHGFAKLLGRTHRLDQHELVPSRPVQRWHVSRLRPSAALANSDMLPVCHSVKVPNRRQCTLARHHDVRDALDAPHLGKRPVTVMRK
ncbi:hypothetical protein BM1_09070 [Bipolaris maydis]|nr:hypothetical protein BM1_09070 [Bipolaris maydis]